VFIYLNKTSTNSSIHHAPIAYLKNMMITNYHVAAVKLSAVSVT